MLRKLLCGLGLLAVLLVANCGPTPEPVPSPEPASGAEPAAMPRPPDRYWPTDTWVRTTPEEQGMDSEQLAATLDWIEEEQLNLHSLLVIRNGYLVTEAYFQPYTAETRAPIQSVTKSVIGMLVGIALDQGELASTGQDVLGFFPGRHVRNRDASKEAITLEHLLSLTAGLECSDMPGSGSPSMVESAHWVQYMLDQPMVSEPGRVFNYCSGAVHLLSAIVEEASGAPVRELANDRLFAPLGIRPVTEDEWLTDPDGRAIGGYGLKLTPLEMARLGYLYLNDGQWDGEQIVPAGWVAASTRQHAAKEDGSGYGYLLTVFPGEGTYAALGLAGQYVYVVPALDLVVVTTGAVNDIGLESPGYLALRELLTDHILPAARSVSPLPANPPAAARLAERVQAAARPTRPVPPAPPTARRISGKTYHLETVAGDLESIRLVFAGNAPEATLTINGVQEMAIGLDNVYRLPGDAPAGAVPAFRGRWENDATFVVDQVLLGELAEYRVTLTFAGDQVTISLEDVILSGDPIQVRGTW